MSAPPLAPAICVFGTASDVGKSWIATGLCRLLRQDGVRVAPFKAQNLSNNAGVTPEGGEMGRAQIAQAEACGLPPHVDMNPLLLKPNAEIGAQVVLLGRVLAIGEAGFEARRQAVLAALDRLRARHELVVVEGAGSCAEVNLRERDLVNFDVAHHADAPVILVADIERGGVFAQIVGTLAVLPAEDRARVRGVIINRFRGDPTCFEGGRAWLERETGVPILGVVPWTDAARIDPEDALPPNVRVDAAPPRDRSAPDLAVLRLPHLANFTDVEPLLRHGVRVHWLAAPRSLEGYDALILPGTKNTRADLAWLRARGWDREIERFARGGGHVLGICGGYQLLGRRIDDPAGVEGAAGGSDGLGLLDAVTTLAGTKRTCLARGTWRGERVAGYEIHMGVTERGDVEPFLRLDEREGAPIDEDEGAATADGRVAGTYLHGLFDEPAATSAWLARLRPDLALRAPSESQAAFRDRQIDALAAHLRGCLDGAALRGFYRESR